MQELGCAHNPEIWQRFVDSSKFILTEVQQLTGNILLPPCPQVGKLREYGFSLENYMLSKI
jgi:hypothetical protein